VKLQVVVTGGGGALGQALVRAIAQKQTLVGPGGAGVPVDRILAVDRIQPPGLFLDARLEYVRAEYEQPRFLARMMGINTASFFHLAPVDEGGESDEPAPADRSAALDALEHALAVSIDATRALLDACRHQAVLPRLVHAGYAPAPDGALPQTTRATCAAISELLAWEAARQGLVDVRCVRLPLSPIDAQRAAQALIDAHELAVDAQRVARIVDAG
jgi:D-erythronate 2-dehydrogenase